MRFGKLPDGSANRHHVYPPRAGLTQRRGSRGNGRAARVHVVDEDDDGRRATRGGERAADVRAPLGEREPALLAERACSAEERLDAKVPPASELDGEPLGRMMAAADAPVPVRRHERQHRPRRGQRDGLLDEIRSNTDDPPQPSLLPRRYERLDRRVVGDRCPRRAEREAAAGALAAPVDRPLGGRAAPGTERLAQPRQPVAAAAAELAARETAHDAALRQEELEQHWLEPTRE